MKFIFALVACLGAFNLATGTPLASEDGIVVSHADPAVDTAALADRSGFSAKETRDATQFTIPPGIHLIPANQTVQTHTGHNHCSSMAAFFQSISFSGIPGIPNTVFSGSGEGTSLTASPVTPSPGNTKGLVILPTTDGFLLTLFFQFSSSGSGGPLQTAVINNLPESVVADNELILTVTSEDSVDNDNNDSEVTIIVATGD
ncbi:uncharacterized protein PHACADRAFT_207448 [Phanerochaete carnosa HHB-10118-sp]|uniref:Uncharacterized protein n=1 Tax=Phanerochaete carnosa (strain HHB-10118-sp) TaxID=650164 RepID=K5X6Y9_PHACS|nr:uncharacterized protein PHACADRAFT_207448 [Phanerochaete carnosa HHB-10118-sp]EKM58647.1 hypothetical protein PHACADRAFT_207448 [Phanerochaete carnosa HHB-10118-sp]